MLESFRLASLQKERQTLVKANAAARREAALSWRIELRAYPYNVIWAHSNMVLSNFSLIGVLEPRFMVSFRKKIVYLSIYFFLCTRCSSISFADPSPSFLLTLLLGLQKEKRGEVSNHDLSARNFTFARLIAMVGG